MQNFLLFRVPHAVQRGRKSSSFASMRTRLLQRLLVQKMFSSSSDTTLTCPRCRHVSVVGNSVQGLRKNFAMLALTDAASGGDNFDYTDDEDDEADAHPEIGEESSGVEMWDAIVAGGGGRCKHRVAVKKMSLREGSLYLLMDRCFGSVQSEMQRNEGRLT